MASTVGKNRGNKYKGVYNDKSSQIKEDIHEEASSHSSQQISTAIKRKAKPNMNTTQALMYRTGFNPYQNIQSSTVKEKSIPFVR